MFSIYKFQLFHSKLSNETTIRMPVGAEIISCQMQDKRLMFWAKVDPSVTAGEDRRFYLAATGQQVNDMIDEFIFIDTVQVEEDGFYGPELLVFHLFEVK